LINILIPSVCSNEQRFSLDVMMREFLGLHFTVELYSGNTIRINRAGCEGELTLDATFFQQANHAWLKLGSMPRLPLSSWAPIQDGLDVSLVEDKVPVLYGQAGLIKKGNHWHLNLDVFGSAFFMLSRYEELITKDRDKHNRFPATASIAYKAGFLDRPIVNEYLEILWACMHQLWPSLERKKRQFRNLISCDVDYPIDTVGYSFKQTTLRVLGRLLRGNDIPLVQGDILNYVFKKFGSDRFDVYFNNIKWLMDENDKAGNKVAFFFIPKQTSSVYDDLNIFSSVKVHDLLMDIFQKGHEIGFHPGYGTYNSEASFNASVSALKYIYNELGVKNIGGRQHYLRYDVSITPRLWDESGFVYDSSLGFADKAGFRCGVCYEYTMFDLANRKPLKIKQRPLVAMDCSIVSNGYEGLGYTDKSLERFNLLKERCRRFNGGFTLLWHNSFFSDKKSKGFYLALIRA